MLASLRRPSRSAAGDVLSTCDFHAAFDEHVQWKTRFEAALRAGGGDQAADVVARGGGTRLGAWLQAVPKVHDANEPMLAELRRAFAQFHSCAARALALARGGDTAAAQQTLTRGAYLPASLRIKRLLVELEKRRQLDPGATPSRSTVVF